MTRRSRIGEFPTVVSVLLALFIGIGGLGLTGCASQTELPPQVTQDLANLRDQLVQGKAQIQTTCNAARDLTQRPQAQLEPQVKRLVDSIATLEGVATEHRTGFTSAEQHTAAYFAHWDRQLQGMSQSLAEKGAVRRAESERTFKELKARTETLRDEFRPFMNSLLEISRYLQTDTTAMGVKTVTPDITRTIAREKALMDKANAVIAQIDAMRGGR